MAIEETDKRVVKADSHLCNSFKLILPAFVVLLLAALSALASVVMAGSPVTWSFSVAAFIFSCVASLLFIPLMFEGLVRLVEYDRLIAELDRIDATHISNPKVDKLLSVFNLTHRRRYVLALGLVARGIAKGNGMSEVAFMYNDKPPVPKYATASTLKEWIGAVFTPISFF